MKVSECADRPVLSACSLADFDYQVDTYIGCEHYCYYCYVLGQAETDWSKEIRIHKDIVGQLAGEMEQITPQTIYMGYHSDPYQPAEAEYCQTRKVLELFLERGFSASILTKSDLVCRDIDILKRMKDSAVSVSVAFNDNQVRGLLEANTVDTEKRIDALRQLKEAGVRTGAMICPIIPFVTDPIPLVHELASCADVMWIYGLTMADRSDPGWLNVQRILKRRFPESADQIESVIFAADQAYWQNIRAKLLSLRTDRSLNINVHL